MAAIALDDGFDETNPSSMGVGEYEDEPTMQQAQIGVGVEGKKLAEEQKKLFRVHKTILKMLRSRGYGVPDRHINMTYKEFVKQYGDEEHDGEGTKTGRMRRGQLRERLHTKANLQDNENVKINVEFSTENKVGVEPIRSISKFMQDEGFQRSILVVQAGGLTPFARSALQMVEEQFKIEHFKESELLVDITEHELVPKHVVLQNAEKLELLARYKLKESQLPRLQVNDPVARYFGLVRGQVVKIIRPSETAGRYVTYRIVW